MFTHTDNDLPHNIDDEQSYVILDTEINIEELSNAIKSGIENNYIQTYEEKRPKCCLHFYVL